MTWWNEGGAHWGWTGCLIAAVMLLVFWSAVFAVLKILFGMTRSQPCQDAATLLGRPVARQSEGIAPDEVGTTPQRRC